MRAVWQNNTNNPPADAANIYLRRSTNYGQTWGDPIKVNDDTGTKDQWNPALAVTPNGARMFVGFYDRRNDLGHGLRHTFGAIFNIELGNGNLTAQGNLQVSASNYGISPVPDRESDYDTAAADRSYFYYARGDNRDVQNLSSITLDRNIRFTRIPVP